MDLKNIVYATALSTLLSCATTAIPNLQNPEVRAQFLGTYKGVVEGHKVTYKVGTEGCVVLVDYGLLISHIIDNDCNNAGDLLNMRLNRQALLTTGKAESVDAVLRMSQEELVNPEHKVK